jgi:hypothetical protein
MPVPHTRFVDAQLPGTRSRMLAKFGDVLQISTRDSVSDALESAEASAATAPRRHGSRWPIATARLLRLAVARRGGTMGAWLNDRFHA